MDELELERERQRVDAEELALVLPSFTNDEAIELGLALLEKARQRRLAVAIDVERGGQRLFHAALPGTSPDNAAWIERKKALVRRTFRSSYATGLKLRAKGQTQEEAGLPSATYAAHGGGVPVVVRDVGCVGAVTVSGLPQRDDHELVVEALREHLARRATRP